MARPTMPGGVTAGDYITETWGDRTNAVLDWIGQDHVTWDPNPWYAAAQITGTDRTVAYARRTKIGSLFVAYFAITINKTAISQVIGLDTPYTLTNAYAVGGSAYYYDTGTNVSTSLTVGVSSTTRVNFVSTAGANFATDPAIGDALIGTIYGLWE